jgi:hypothetical protein
VIIFYSWQADLPASTNRTLVEDALRLAVKDVAAEDTVDVITIERDVCGNPGAPDISATIFEMIANSDVFVGDVSIVHRAESGRFIPNPNVLVELGFAVGTLGWERVVMVANESYGP